jgi:hypothetical protein
MMLDGLSELLCREAHSLNEHPSYEMARSTVTNTKARQSFKILEVRKALLAAGVRGLNEQARVLGLSRSTTWTILKAQHKTSGISAPIINRILRSQELPPLVRSVIEEYSAEKAAGFYGGSLRQRRRFAARVSKPCGRSMPTALPHTPFAYVG